MPSGISGVVIADIAGVPAENHVAEAEAGFHGVEKLVFVQVFAAENAVNIRDGNFDFLKGGFFEFL